MLSSCSRVERRGYPRGIARGLSPCQRRKGSDQCFACGAWGAVVRGCLKIWFTSVGGPPRPAHFPFRDPEQKLTQATEQLLIALEPLIDPICRAHGVELVEVRCLREPAGLLLRLIIDRDVPGLEVGSGVSLEDCTGVSRDLSTTLDVHDDLLPPGGYRLEVSSPGLERPLVKLADFERFSGREVKVRTDTPIERQRRFRGKLLRVVDESIELDQDGKVLLIPHAEIAQANLVYRFSN
jgi:ribosome maturation factor RimP